MTLYHPAIVALGVIAFCTAAWWAIIKAGEWTMTMIADWMAAIPGEPPANLVALTLITLAVAAGLAGVFAGVLYGRRQGE